MSLIKGFFETVESLSQILIFVKKRRRETNLYHTPHCPWCNIISLINVNLSLIDVKSLIDKGTHHSFLQLQTQLDSALILSHSFSTHQHIHTKIQSHSHTH